ncbi:sensor histidine kinase [Corynebacterium sp.]|uniref:sensor histidine kinase n=1 Tax=Corynebacterium sp. TaxID=1720 RepID=UPI003B3BB5CD
MRRTKSPSRRTAAILAPVARPVRHAVDRTAAHAGVPPLVLFLTAVFTGILFATAWPTYFVTHSLHPAIVPLLAVLGTWPVLASLWHPWPSWLMVALACLVSVPLRGEPGFMLGWPVPFHLALAFTLAVVVVRGSRDAVAAAVAGTVVLMLFNPGEVVVGWVVGALVWTLVCLLLRWLLASRRDLRREETRTSEQSEMRVMAEERNRLARDLHDVVAHQMSMIVVQAQSAPYRLQGVTPAIHAEFDSLSDTAREALNQVRELLGVLRSDAESGTTTPVGTDQIGPTLQAARRAGMDVTWSPQTVDPVVAALDDTTGVVLHRVLQESLANASRHAPGGTVLVDLELEDGWATLTVDNGPAAAGAIVPPEHSGGAGIQGMSARVRAVGGTFTALPAADGGFTVTAGVPLPTR